MKICIIKLGADGDVLRTLPLAKAMKKRYGQANITWITRGDIKELLREIDYIDNVLTVPYYGPDKFDLLYNFDIEKEALQLAEKIEADKKYGFCNDNGYPVAFNIGAEYYLNTLFDDELKKNNKKTYQEMMFLAANLPYDSERYKIVLNENDKKYANDFVNENNLRGKKIIGIHMGASSRWPSKVWHQDRLKAFIRKSVKKDYNVLLFGGPNEVESHALLASILEKEGLKIYRNNPHNTKREFASLVNVCNTLICSDSFALHVSIGLGKRTIGLFFCTSYDEVEGYGLLVKLIAPRLKEFFPEKMDVYDENLVKSISEDDVLKEIR